MFTICATVLVGLVVFGIVLKIADSIVVDTWTISTRDHPNTADREAGSAPFSGPVHAMGSPDTGARS